MKEIDRDHVRALAEHKVIWVGERISARPSLLGRGLVGCA